MNMFLEKLVGKLVRTGTLVVTGSDGKETVFGDGSGTPVHVVFHTRRAERAVALDPALALGEAYANGEIDIQGGDLMALLKLAFANRAREEADTAWTRALQSLRDMSRRLRQWNTINRSRKNVHHHYDLSHDFYRLFLDKDLQYSCAYFDRADATLDEAQLAKKHHIASKLRMQSGLRVLDIGSGWGGLGLYLAHRFAARVLGVTLSAEQQRVSAQRAQDSGLPELAQFMLCDYRQLDGSFDRIVSVGMFEHVGVNHYRTFFDCCARLLRSDGVMLLHSIGHGAPPSATNPFIEKYIFPGGYIPSLSEVLPAVEKSGLIVKDIEILHLHYAETLRHWRERFLARREQVREIYDERFCRMWEFYLAGSEASFRWRKLMVFQLLLTHRNDSLPMTRDYMGEAERRLAGQHGFSGLSGNETADMAG